MNMAVKDRLMKYLEYKELSMRKFSLSCGMSESYVRSIRNSIQPDKMSVISTNYPDLNMGWIMTGEGQMLKQTNPEEKIISPEASVITTNYIPLIPISAQAGSLNDFTHSIGSTDCEKIISPISGAEYAMPVNGDSMAPEYPSGSIVLLRKINESAFIDWGKTYVLDTCNGIVVKTLTPSDKQHHVRCLSINPDPRFAPFDIDLNNIFGIYRVLLCMSTK